MKWGEQRAGARTACGRQDLPTSGCEVALGCANFALFFPFCSDENHGGQLRWKSQSDRWLDFPRDKKMDISLLQNEDINEELVGGKLAQCWCCFPWPRAEARRGPRMSGSTEDQTCLSSGFGKGDDSSAIHPPSLGSLEAEGMDPMLKRV